MTTDTAAPKTARMGLGCNLILWVGIGLFIGLTLTASIQQINRALAGLVHCSGAQEIVFDTYNAGTSQQRFNGTARNVSGTAFTMICTFNNGAIKTVENDLAVITGFASGALIGGVVGLIIALFFTWRERDK